MKDDMLRNRRPLASRRLRVTGWMVERLLRTRITPDQISAAGVVAAFAAGLALAAAPGSAVWYLVAAVFVQLRLLANMLDGLIAVEGGRGGPLGPLWNEMPDRLEDTAILTGFGLAAASLPLGLAAALAAVGCAYVRTLGGALGQDQSFAGPMAKQHRMAAVTGGSILAFAGAVAGFDPARLSLVVLWFIVVGSLVTIVRRTAIIARALKR